MLLAIVAYFVGDRTTKSCEKFWETIPEQYRKLRSYSDLHEPYNQVFDQTTHISTQKTSGLTNHIERFNLTLRQRMSRLVRKTLSFSKYARSKFKNFFTSL